MTCVVAVTGPNGRMIFGADSLVSYDEDGTYASVSAETKVWRDGPYLFGAAGSSRACQIARYAFRAPAPVGRGERLDRFMATTFVDALRKVMFEGGHMLLVEESREEMDGTFLVGVRGTLYTIRDWFDFDRLSESYAAIGSGTRPALGALYATADLGATKKRVLTALAAAETYDSAVRRPFVVITNEG